MALSPFVLIVLAVQLELCFGFGITTRELVVTKPITVATFSGEHKRTTTSLCGEKDDDDDNDDDDDESEFVESFKDAAFRERTKRWVVLVDDEEAIRLAVGDYLYESGYQVTACADADALLEVLHVNSTDPAAAAASSHRIPSAVVSDVRMPGKDGLELLRLLRADERLARVPVVLLTAKSLTADRVEGYRAGADVYLSKPFDPEELLAIVDNVVARRSQIVGNSDASKLVELRHGLADVKRALERNAARVVRDDDAPSLTPREIEVLELLCRGHSNGEIADERGVAVTAVHRAVQSLYGKTSTRSRTELVRWAIQTGHVSRR